MSRPARMVGRSWFFPHGYLNNWAEHLIGDAQDARSGSANYYRISALLAVMSFEAYLNYVGERYVEEWPERKSWAKKLVLILEKFGLTPLRDQEPFTLLKDLFDYRNSLAHARIFEAPVEYIEHRDGRFEGDQIADPEWYLIFGTREQAERTLQIIRDAMQAIHQVADPTDPRHPWWIHAVGRSIAVKADDQEATKSSSEGTI
ncbi:hypothetical protein AB1L88_19705 [Tautonia sp. JC769]|uniref:hypothetical protein n=1 Tax=Tautonia sp. JC769 TaxID=3232135 RepID=UPI0034579A01